MELCFLPPSPRVPPLCLCMGQSLFENAFPLVHLAPPHSSFRIPLWEALLFYQACWLSLLWANTIYHHLSVTGLPRLDHDHWLLICSPPAATPPPSPLHREFCEPGTGPCPDSESQNLALGLAQSRCSMTQKGKEWAGPACGLGKMHPFTMSSARSKSSPFFHSSANCGVAMAE